MQHEFNTSNGNLSLNRDKKSPYWMVNFTAADGSRKRRSTKVPIDGGFFRGKMVSAATSKKVAFLEAVRLFNNENLRLKEEKTMTVKKMIEKHLQMKAKTLSPASYRDRQNVLGDFANWLGVRANEEIRSIKREDAINYMYKKLEGFRSLTVKKYMVILNCFFNTALDLELIERNPFVRVRVPAIKDQVEKQAFGLDEVKYLIENLPRQWSDLVRCCIGSFGQRLRDVLKMKWEQLDLERKIIKLRTAKTARIMELPMTESFYTWAVQAKEEAEKKGGDYATFIHCDLMKLSTPSVSFGAELEKLGFREKSPFAGTRKMRLKTFHSLRRTVATMLHASGLSEGFAMNLVGHSSQTVHSVYVKPSIEQLREATKKLPDL